MLHLVNIIMYNIEFNYISEMGDFQPKKLRSGHEPQWGPGTKTNWATDLGRNIT
jgi:hypothetical protein